MNRRRAHTVLATGLAAAAVAVAGCDTPSALSESGSQTTTHSGSVTTASSKCLASQLTASLTAAGGDPDDTNVTTAELMVTNTRKASCTLQGYPGLGLYTLDKATQTSPTQLIPTQAVRTLQPGPKLVTLGPGQSAKANLRWVSGLLNPGRDVIDPCQPAPEQLRVIPPDDTKQVSIEWDYASVCDGRIEESAFYQ